MKIARPVPLEPIVEALEQARAAGATHLTFLGGEPTIHKRFLDALAKAVELGFEHVVIFTNGVMFTHPGFIDSVTALGNFEWRISIQGATEEAHVAVTGRAESFRRIVHGLEELQQRGQMVTANMCVNERSYRSLPHYPELFTKYGVRQLHVDIVRPESTGERDEDYLRDIMPRYSDMAPYYAEMLAGFERWNPDFDINVGNLPYCILPEWGSRIHHGGQDTVTKSSDGSGLEDEMNKYAWQASLRTHLPGCADCVFRARCTGIFRVYLELHGGDEFQPLTRESLAARDPQRRNFVLLVETLLAPLRDALATAALPHGWRLQHEATEDRRRQIEMVFTHQTGSNVRLRFVPAGNGETAVISSAAYDVEAETDLSLSADAFSTLLDWVHGRLAAGLDLSSPPLRAVDAYQRAVHHAVVLRGRQRVTGIGTKLRARFALPGWRLEALRWASESTAELSAIGPDAARVDVRFAISVRDGRSQIGVDFGVSDGGDRLEVRTAADQLVGLLRGAQASDGGQKAFTAETRADDGKDSRLRSGASLS